MADFSPSGIYGFPVLNAEALQGIDTRDGARGDPRVIGWINEAAIEGDRINRSDPSFDKADLGMRYIVGEQRRDPAEDQIKYLPKMIVNEARKVTQAHSSVLTDLKPFWAYKSTNPHFETHGQLINQLVIAWYINTQADIELGDVVKYSLAGGTADCKVEWDPHARFGGDHRILASDFRDTLPWRPAPRSRDIQDWQGVIFREEHTINVLRGMYPTKAPLFKATSDSLLATLMGRFRQLVSRVVSPAADTLAGLSASASANLKPRSGNVLLYRLSLEDHTRNLTAAPIPMGPPGATWAYVVQPGERMYPNKRCIVATPDAIVWDGPSPFWHGMHPVSRLKLWSVPWHFLGVPLLGDLIPIQDAINDVNNDIRLAIKQWMDRTTVYDRQAVSETFMKLHDARRPGAKVKTNPTYGDGFKLLEGIPPQVISLALEYLTRTTDKFSDLSGVANLQKLLELRQMPGADTIRQYYEAMTPEIRSEGRQVEAFIRPVAEMIKTNIFQYMTQEKRITLLGDAGLTLSDFDFDPKKLVPAMEKGQQGYSPELDASLPHEQRAQYFQKMFAFTVAPNSILAMNAAEQKMLRLQLSRMGYYDFWSLLEALEVPNVGAPPAIPLPPLQSPDPQEVLQSMLLAATTGVQGKYTLSPNGQILEIRTPMTVTERLMAQQQLGIGMTENPAGRKASGQETPQQETKKDDTGAPRQTVTESPK